jgi:hypothetical protein
MVSDARQIAELSWLNVDLIRREQAAGWNKHRVTGSSRWRRGRACTPCTFRVVIVESLCTADSGWVLELPQTAEYKASGPKSTPILHQFSTNILQLHLA